MATWILGVTGGIGSGKTAATDYLQKLGVTVVDADVVAREVVAPGTPALAAIAAHFGPEAIIQDGAQAGQLNRPWMRQCVFSDPNQRLALEAITHPAIRDALMQQLMAAPSAYAVLASPLLWESGQVNFVLRTLLIDVSEATQVQRASGRDGVSPAQIEAIMKAQWSRTQRRERADDIISNEGSLAELYAQLDALHQQYLELAAR
ncbi:MAG: dephospho-CoA kinase [Pseudomonadota bacterium]